MAIITVLVILISIIPFVIHHIDAIQSFKSAIELLNPRIERWFVIYISTTTIAQMDCFVTLEVGGVTRK